MNDLISRQALKEKLHFMFEWYGRLPCSEEDKCIQRTIKRCMGELDKAPAIDTVEIVRCKDCEKWDAFADGLDGAGYCYKWHDNVQSDGYCYYGERKEVSEDV